MMRKRRDELTWVSRDQERTHVGVEGWGTRSRGFRWIRDEFIVGVKGEGTSSLWVSRGKEQAHCVGTEEGRGNGGMRKTMWTKFGKLSNFESHLRLAFGFCPWGESQTSHWLLSLRRISDQSLASVPETRLRPVFGFCSWGASQTSHWLLSLRRVSDQSLASVPEARLRPVFCFCSCAIEN